RLDRLGDALLEVRARRRLGAGGGLRPERRDLQADLRHPAGDAGDPRGVHAATIGQPARNLCRIFAAFAKSEPYIRAEPSRWPSRSETVTASTLASWIELAPVTLACAVLVRPQHAACSAWPPRPTTRMTYGPSPG